MTVVKAQVKTGGRGKAGGVKVAKSAEEAEQLAAQILGMDIKGHTVKTVMIAQGARIAEEYHSILLDRANRTYLAMCSKEGGMDIEQLAVERPEALAKIAVDPNVGIDTAKAQEIVDAAGFDAETGAKIVPVLEKLWDVYQGEDATLVEVNPLVKTEDGDIVALDGKVSLDANADFRQPDHAALEDKEAADPLEAAAKEKDLNYVKLDGNVGIIGNGAGLVMSTLDVVAYAGEEHTGGVPKPANFLDIGAAPAPRSCRTGCTSSWVTRRSRLSSSTSSVASPHATPSPTASWRLWTTWATRPPSRSSSASTATTWRKAGASSPSATIPLVTIEETMDGAAQKAAELAAAN